MTNDQNERWDKVRSVWEIIGRLRGEGGCPWDRKQTPESLQTYLIEEAHEAALAVRSGRIAEVSEELGDLLFMVFFVTRLYEERGDFKLEEVCEQVHEKMVRRHPHVFGDVTVHSTREVLDNWEKIKAGEKNGHVKPSDSIPESLPALMRAYRLLARVAPKNGSGWNDRPARAEEYVEKSGKLGRDMLDGGQVTPEAFGEVLLEIANLARLHGYRPEDCLHDALRSLDE